MSEQDSTGVAQVQPTVRLERFTPEARNVLAFAEDEARALNHNYMGTEHLLLGLIREEESIAALALRSLNVELSRVRGAVEQIIGRGDTPITGDIHLTPRAVAATAMAVSEALRLGQDTVGPEHLLLGLVREGEGIAAGVLESQGATLDFMPLKVLEAIAGARTPRVLAALMGTAQTLAAPKSAVVTCRINADDLNAIDALIEAGVRSTRSDAAAWLIHAGIEAHRVLLDNLNATVTEIRRLREVAQSLAQTVMSPDPPAVPPAPEPPAAGA